MKSLAMTMLCGCVLLIDGPAASEAEPEVDCSKAETQMEMNVCAGREYEAADLALNAQWKLTKALMDRVDAERQEKAGVSKLVASQRAWLAYRDAQCALDGHAMEGGSAQPLLVSSCLAELTRKRTDELKSLNDAFGN